MRKDLLLPERRLDLALPWAPQPVREWVREPANSVKAPKSRTGTMQPQVINASRVPRLSGADLLEKHRAAQSGTATAARSAERSTCVEGGPAVPLPLRRGTSGPRSIRWQVLLSAAVVLALSTPAF